MKTSSKEDLYYFLLVASCFQRNFKLNRSDEGLNPDFVFHVPADAAPQFLQQLTPLFVC